MDCCLHLCETRPAPMPDATAPATAARGEERALPAAGLYRRSHGTSAPGCGPSPNQGATPEQREYADLTGIAASAIAIAKVRQRAGHVGFELHPLPRAHVVPERMREVFVALFEHALTFTRDVPAPRIVIGAQGAANAPEIVIQDNGVGFDTCTPIRVLDPDGGLHFTADDDSTLGRVRRLIAQHGGRLRMHSAAWGGTTFSFTLGASAPRQLT